MNSRRSDESERPDDESAYPESAIPLRPLDAFAGQPPQARLGGHDGLNRADPDGLQIQASNDLEALSCFLQEYQESEGTHRVYSRECERLILWSWIERDKPFSSLNRQDFEAYLRFLQDPQPADRWCGKKAPRCTSAWRPFVGPLQKSAILTAMASVNSFSGYLVDAGYLKGNPLALIRQRGRKLDASAALGRPKPAGTDGTKAGKRSASKHTEEASKVERYLDKPMWAAVNTAVEALPRETDKHRREYERARFVLALLYLMAPRAGDLEGNLMSSFRESGGQWWWHLVGKGDKAAKLPVPDDMVQAMTRYRLFLGLSAMPSRKDTTPLLCSLDDPPTPIGARRLHQILKAIFSAAADLLGPGQAHKAEKLRSASTHWGRHTSITHMDESGLSPRLVQKSARHSDPRTTQLYMHDDPEHWHSESQRVRLGWAEGGAQPAPPSPPIPSSTPK